MAILINISDTENWDIIQDGEEKGKNAKLIMGQWQHTETCETIETPETLEREDEDGDKIVSVLGVDQKALWMIGFLSGTQGLDIEY